LPFETGINITLARPRRVAIAQGGWPRRLSQVTSDLDIPSTFFKKIAVYCSKRADLLKTVEVSCIGKALFWSAVLLVISMGRPETAVSQDRIPEPPQLVGSSEEAEQAISQFQYPSGIRCEVFAAEPDVANIVAFHRDFQGRLFACETFRQEFGVEDNRRHAHWMDEELQAQKVQDRIDYIRKYIPDADEAYTAKDDRIRLLLDQDGDGAADVSKVFSDRYNRIEMGTGAGVLSYRDKVYYTCIPELFLLTDADGNGVAERRESLHSGFGVRFAFRGHDMHGLIVGPDGRLYFSIGDRGYNVSPEIKNPVSGAVFRCELDGSDLEVVCTGLRNPQELAFDDYGNLFTGDNNSDSGDMARWVFLVPGSDSGWRMYYQYLEDRGPFNREKIWEPFSEDTPAYIVPPIANISDGPSGLEYYPGTGFGDEFLGRFFLCDFRGVATTSGIRSFKNQPKGAFFDLVEDEKPFWNILATDLDFGSDGRLYVSDWVFGWDGENKGRIYTFTDESHSDSAIVREVQELLRDGLAQQSLDQLKRLLSHQDRRVRQEAQFELVGRGNMETLKEVALNEKLQLLPRIHAIWGLGQLARASARRIGVTTGDSLSDIVSTLLKDADAEVRAQAAQLVAEAKMPMEDQLIGLLGDDNLRVRYFAAMALSKLGTVKSIGPIAEMLEKNNNVDPIVRHGGIMALYGMMTNAGSDNVLEAIANQILKHESPSVRLALCVAARKVLSQNVPNDSADASKRLLAELLNDSDAKVFVETVRVIHDVPVGEHMSQLADVLPALKSRLTGSIDDDAILRRVINANLRVGATENANRLSAFAADADFPVERRLDALTALENWAAPPSRDAVLNDWRPVLTEGRKLVDAQNALVKNFHAYTKASEKIASAAINAAGSLKIDGIGAGLSSVALSDEFSDATRSSALANLNKLDRTRTKQALNTLIPAFPDLPDQLAATVADAAADQDPRLGLELAGQVFGRTGEETTKAKQMVIATIGQIEDDVATRWLLNALEEVSSTNFPAALRLDVVMAAENRQEPAIQQRLEEYRNELAADEDPAMVYTDTLVGGDAEAGRQVFFGKTEVSCVRCHRIFGTGGKVGPDLSGVGLKNDRKYLLESMVNPNKAITEGYGTVKVQTIDGMIYVGIVQSESETQLQLMDADGKKFFIAQDDIEGIKPGLSAMPDDLAKQLSHNEIRDLVAYLATLKTPVAPANASEHEMP
jgi:quinoprotein glucose dehydrogenase